MSSPTSIKSVLKAPRKKPTKILNNCMHHDEEKLTSSSSGIIRVLTVGGQRHFVDYSGRDGRNLWRIKFTSSTQHLIETNDLLILINNFVCRETFTCEKRDSVSGIENKCKSANLASEWRTIKLLSAFEFNLEFLRCQWGQVKTRGTPCPSLL